MKTKTRYPAIVIKDFKIACRGCGGDIPSNRKTWCSKNCYDEKCPERVILKVRHRDQGKCQICGVETIRLQPTYMRGEEYSVWQARITEWRDKLRPEYDHIIPFSEGGATSLENMRTLCRACHVDVTAKWRKEKARITV